MTLDIELAQCPICKTHVEPQERVCGHCGALLANYADGIVTTRSDLEGMSLENIDKFLLEQLTIPVRGCAIYLVGATRPLYTCTEDEFVIGRRVEGTPDVQVDLSSLGAYALGLSRRHVKIRRADSGYEIMDLSSSNGTWLNAERLVPNRRYPLPNRAQLRLARMRLFILYRSGAETT